MVNMNFAWEKAHYKTYIRSRLLALAFLFGLVILMLLALLLTGVLNLFARFSIPFLGGKAISETFLWQAATGILSPVITFFIFLLIYRFVPNTRVRYREALWGALLVTGLWELTSLLFRWYLNSGLANYDLIYGSIATLAVLMVWFDINSVLVLFGAHLSAAIARFRARQKAVETPPARTV
jgi:membrane protein